MGDSRVTLLAIDPGRSYKGERTIGVSLWSEEEVGETGRLKWQELFREESRWEELVEELHLLPNTDWETMAWDGTWSLAYGDFVVDEVVIEDFVNDPKSARGGQRNGTSECIGAVEILATQAGVPFTRQRSDKLGPAKMHAPEGSWKNLKHLRHEDSAFLHGYEYLVGKGVLQPAGLADTL